MTEVLQKNRRKTLRLKNYDYSLNGAYFVTICTNNRNPLFGKIHDRKMTLNSAGNMIIKWWLEINNKFLSATTDEYVIMPNHFHGIIEISENKCGRTHRSAPTKDKEDLKTIIQWFKTMTTNEYIREVKTKRLPPFEKSLWQRNYFEHVIRNENDLNLAREYIIMNPENWDKDTLFI